MFTEFYYFPWMFIDFHDVHLEQKTERAGEGPSWLVGWAGAGFWGWVRIAERQNFWSLLLATTTDAATTITTTAALSTSPTVDTLAGVETKMGECAHVGTRCAGVQVAPCAGLQVSRCSCVQVCIVR